MKFIAKAVLVLMLAGAAVVIDGAIEKGYIPAIHNGEVHAQVAQAQSQPSNNPAVVYAYTVQSGDTYSYIARKAVQTYGKKANVKLSQAQIVYAETNLTLQAGSPILVTGQKVEVDESAAKQWVDKARTLSTDEQAAWQYYVQFVDFNTDHVGTAH